LLLLFEFVLDDDEFEDEDELVLTAVCCALNREV
jgi:hypothetical protein